MEGAGGTARPCHSPHPLLPLPHSRPAAVAPRTVARVGYTGPLRLRRRVSVTPSYAGYSVACLLQVPSGERAVVTRPSTAQVAGRYISADDASLRHRLFTPYVHTDGAAPHAAERIPCQGV